MKTIDDAMTAWLESMRRTRSAPDARSAAHRVMEDLGPRPLEELSPLEIQRWLDSLRGDHAPNRIRGYYWALAGALRSALLAGELDRDLLAARHTFITLAVEGGAREEAIFACTHGDPTIHGVYRHWQWASLCEAVSLIPVRWERGKDRAK